MMIDTTTPDLFAGDSFTRRGDSIVPPQRAELARAKRDSGIRRAVEHADAVAPGWADGAYKRFESFAKNRATFTTEDVRTCWEALGFATPPDRRAWGGVASRAARAGIVVRDGYEPAKNPAVHCTTVTRWRSKVFAA